MFSFCRNRRTKPILLLILIIFNLCLLYYYVFYAFEETDQDLAESEVLRTIPLGIHKLGVEKNANRREEIVNLLQKPPGENAELKPTARIGKLKKKSRIILPALANKSFIVDYDNNRFLKDGKPFQIFSGSIDYYRVPRAYWRDRLYKLKAAGFNTVCMYSEWVTHEPEPGHYKFGGEQDIEYFISLAAEEDLLVIFRPGPYICSERDAGGFPSWLMTSHPFIRYRSLDLNYKKEVEKWFSVLMPKVTKYFYGNGGPIIMVAVENEYGSIIDCNMQYKLWMRNLTAYYVEDTALLFTVDNFWAPIGLIHKCGSIPEVYRAFDFAASGDTEKNLRTCHLQQQKGPVFNSEFWGGWPTHWATPRNRVPITNVLKSMKHLIEVGASINYYMFHGGTNFGFQNGANLVGTSYFSIQTSYDYDAPLDEAGDPTEKYYAIRELLSKYVSMPNISVPKPAPKGNYGKLEMRPVVSLFDRRVPNDGKVSDFLPKSFENLGIKFGYVLYEAPLFRPQFASYFYAAGLRDRGHLFIDEKFVTVLHRNMLIPTLLIFTGFEKTMKLLVENQGRVHTGETIVIQEKKGLLTTPLLNNIPLTRWTMTKYSFENIRWIETIEPSSKVLSPPAFYIGYLVLPLNHVPLDTYVNLRGWGKGVIFINNINLGRYWPTVGSQITLYVPGCYLRSAPEKNVIVMFETDSVPPSLEIKFQEKHEL